MDFNQKLNEQCGEENMHWKRNIEKLEFHKVI